MEEDKIEKLAGIFRTGVLEEKKERVLFVIGAGCSAEAGVKTSQEIISELNFGLTSEEVRAILEQRNYVIPFDYIPMEAYLSAYKDIFGPAWDEIYTKLRTFFPSRLENSTNQINKPPLTYSLLAHLMKYNLIHSIISLNFDELLEEALDNALGVDGYDIVASRSAFDRAKELQLYLKNKIVYKPHGTISAPLTLRTTWERVNKLDEEKIDVISNVLREHSIWIFMGYKFADLDLAPIFVYMASNRNITKENNLKIWIVNRDSTHQIFKDNRIINPRVNRLLSSQNCISDLTIANHFIKMESERFIRKFIDRLLSSPASSENEISKSNLYQYRKGSGYRVLDILYEGGLTSDIDNILKFTILIFSFISKGKFTDKSLLEFNEIKTLLLKLTNFNLEDTSSDSLSKILYSKLNELLKESGSLSEFFFERKFGMNRVFYLKENLCDENGNPNFTLIAQKMIEYVTQEEGNNNYWSNTKKNVLIRLLRDLWNDVDIMIHDPVTEIPFSLCNKSQIISSLEVLTRKTEEILNQSSELNIVAESGEWLLEAKFFNLLGSINCIKLIITNPGCDDNSLHKKRLLSNLKRLHNKLQNKLNVRYLCFLENTRHMTLNPKKKKGLFFIREAKSPVISPIFLAGTNYNMAQNLFNLLWNKALKNECNKRRCI